MAMAPIPASTSLRAAHAKAWLACVLLCVATLPCAAAPAPDVRILIDVSGSMKRTDPANLRVPALQLLAELLPRDATAGVWLFDGATTPLLAPATVDAQWKKEARRRATRIHSNGRYTDIEVALAAASSAWSEPPAAGSGSRHIVLLTDGLVDTGPDPAASAASRERILGERLAQLKAGGIQVHAVALSQEVDRALLDALADATGGWREDVPDATALQRAFLHMFEQATTPDTLPLKDNSFRVDASVREFTLLVFRDPAVTAPLVLTDPAGTDTTATAPGQHARWQSATGYDLVTVATPAPGEWRFSGAPDPDNRALIVTDLDLDVPAIPASTLPGEELPLAARLLEHGHPIERAEFLALTRATVAAVGADGTGDLRDLALDEAQHAFRGTLDPDLQPGAYELIVRAESATFERETRRRLRIHSSPIVFKTIGKGVEDAGGPRIRLGIAVNPKLVAPATVGGYVRATGPAAEQLVADIPTLADDRTIVDLPVAHGGTWRVTPTVFVTTAAGRSLRLTPAPLEVAIDAPPPEPPARPTSPTPVPALSWGRVAGIAGLGNLALGGVLGPLWLLLRRRESAAEKTAL